MKLIELKSDSFYYCGKSYNQERFISKDKKFYFTRDGIDYVKAYKANSEGKAELIHEIYKEENPSKNPIYMFEDAINKIKELNINSDFELLIDNSHF